MNSREAFYARYPNHPLANVPDDKAWKRVDDNFIDPSIPHIDQWSYITTAQLVHDTNAFIASIPADIDLVAAIPRSGLLPGSLVSYQRHIPLVTVSRQKGVVDPGHGIRLENRPITPPRHILLMDDTVASGKEMRACLPIVREEYPDAKVTRAVIYAHPNGEYAVDLFAFRYPGSHYLEWNWASAGHGQVCGFDFDGLICRDFTEHECRDEESYRTAMATIDPLYLPRRTSVPLIVTARPESTRQITLDWLAKWGVTVDKLIMRDWPSETPLSPPHELSAQWKATHYAASPLGMFAESDPRQAEIIAEITGKAVLCPAMGRVIPPKPRTVTYHPDTGKVLGCQHRVSTCHCLDKPATCARPDHPGPVDLPACLACVGGQSGE